MRGPLDVRVEGRPVQFDGARQRTLFTALALRAPEPVTVELVEAVWAGERARAEQPETASADLEAALGLWRGPALADHRCDEFALREIERLEELRMEAIEERMGAQLARGRDADRGDRDEAEPAAAAGSARQPSPPCAGAARLSTSRPAWCTSPAPTSTAPRSGSSMRSRSPAAAATGSRSRSRAVSVAASL